MTIPGSTPGYRRKPNRHPGYDYSQPGEYFVTLCTENRQILFGNVVNDEMVRNEIGDMIHVEWRSLPEAFPGIELDALMIMPDHLHGLIVLGTDPNAPKLPRLGEVIRYFKGRSTHRYLVSIREQNWPSLDRRLWQQRFHDRIIRNDAELEHIRSYIEANPARWEELARKDP